MNEYESENEHFYNYGILKSGEYDFLDNLYTNKNVAIVGPAATIVGNSLGEYIDSFDTIVRMNKSIPLNEELACDIGSRTDVLYHSLDKIAQPISHNYIKLDEYVEANLKGFVASCRINHIRRDNFRTFYDLNYTYIPDKLCYEDKIPIRTISALVRKLYGEADTRPMHLSPEVSMELIYFILTYIKLAVL